MVRNLVTQQLIMSRREEKEKERSCMKRVYLFNNEDVEMIKMMNDEIGRKNIRE